MKYKNFYLVHFQYLGFRYHGWLKQPNLKTVEAMIEKTIAFILGHTDFNIIGGSRTDAKVSANRSAFELFVDEHLDTAQLLNDFNKNLPNDIRVLNIENVDKDFNIVNTPRIKEYIYLFSYGKKSHPFCAPLMSSFQHHLDIEMMQEGARLFRGQHNFIKYCTKPGRETKTKREVLESNIEENTIFKANFFPEKSYIYRIRSFGFLRYQVRLIMGQLLSLGRDEINLEDIRDSLKGKDNRPLRHIAPASGLILNDIEFI